MLCEKCNAREAIVHITAIEGDAMARRNYCQECASQSGLFDGIDLGTLLAKLRKGSAVARSPIPEGSRFCQEAWDFLAVSLNAALLQNSEAARGLHHVTAKQLLDALRIGALARFGKRAKSVLNNWGFFRTEDFGELVFEMVRFGRLAKRPEDKIEDFVNGYNFDEAFPET